MVIMMIMTNMIIMIIMIIVIIISITMVAPDIRPDNPAFLIFGIRPYTGFDLPDNRSDTRY
jgi:hypothetical protein